jgi:golgi SNAP receptor complex member 1
MSSDGWSTTKREARRAETEVGRKIALLTTQVYSNNQENTNLDPESNRVEGIAVLCNELDDALVRFARVLETMQTMTLEGGTRRQTLSRYNDIYHTSKMDYSKLKTTLARQKQKQELFGRDGLNDSNSDDPARDQLLRERRLLAEATSQGEEIMGKAEAAYNGMKEQGNSLMGASSRMASNVLSRFPMIGTLVERVRRRRQRDQIVIAATIGFLIFFTLWYLNLV